MVTGPPPPLQVSWWLIAFLPVSPSADHRAEEKPGIGRPGCCVLLLEGSLLATTGKGVPSFQCRLGTE